MKFVVTVNVSSVAVFSCLFFLASAFDTIGLENLQLLKFIGRFEKNSSGYYSNWPGSSFQLSILPTLSIANEGGAYTIMVDFNTSQLTKFYVGVEKNCGAYEKYEVNQSQSTISLRVDARSDAVDEFRFTKLSEASYGDAAGVMSVLNISVQNGAMVPSLESCWSHSRTLLVIGDSISAAYGVEGGSADCTYSASTENILDSYASLVASQIDADLHVVAWSGKGVVRNYGDSSQLSEDPMPVFYNRTIATISPNDDSSTLWNPGDFLPDVILIMLGTNDYSTDPTPTDEQFLSGLIELLERIISDYPTAALACICAPSARGNQCTNIESASRQTSTATSYIFIAPDAYEGGYGCDSHPSIETQNNIAAVVGEFIIGNML